VELYTIQMAKWRLAKTLNVPMIDTTCRSKDTLVFSPTTEMVRLYKSGQMSEEEYSKLYNRTMRDSYINNRDAWDELVRRDTVAITCFCREGVFCHRHLLREMLELVCAHQKLPFLYKGEIS